MRIIKYVAVFFLLLSTVMPSMAFADEGAGTSEVEPESEVEASAEDPNSSEAETILPDDTEEVPEETIEEGPPETNAENGTAEESEAVTEEPEASEETIAKEATIVKEEEAAAESEEEAEPKAFRSFSAERSSTQDLSGVEETTSRLGHLNSASVRIYADYHDQSAFIEAGSKNTNEVFYIKKQAEYNNENFYLISRKPSSTTAVAGWVKASDMDIAVHATINSTKTTLYIKGTGSAYDNAWGGIKNDIGLKLSGLAGSAYHVNLTESVGDKIWHRGTIDGKTAWIEAGDVTESVEVATSRLGHLNSADVLIYSDYKNQSVSAEAGTANTNEVFYIKKQASYNNSLYYLISRKPSSTTAVAGWVKASDMDTAAHATVNSKKTTLYIKGTGNAYDNAWGGSKNDIGLNLSGLAGEEYHVNLTEKVGGTTWHRGTVNGKTAWVEDADTVREDANTSYAVEEATSRLGHLNGPAVRIYQDYAKPASYILANTANTNEVFYIKKQANFNNALYYLISRKPSSTTALVGWVKATDMNSAAHATLNSLKKTLYVKGTGNAYNNAWGGTKNQVNLDLADLAGEKYLVNLTEKVGNKTWYRGTINGKTTWIEDGNTTSAIEEATSRLGHLNSAAVKIYPDYKKQSAFTEAEDAFMNAVFYIKKQVIYNNDLYYLLSRKPSTTTAVAGWVKATDMSTAEHATVNSNKYTLYIKGSGNAYNNAWGGSKNDINLDLSKLAGEEYQVNLTEQVGEKIWHRGTVDGQTAWIEGSDVSMETPTSRLGHVNGPTVHIYQDYAKQNSYIEASSANTNEVFYIKKQANYNSNLYYLISRKPSSTTAVVGWVKASDMNTAAHATINSTKTTLYIKGTGNAYDDAWGGSRNDAGLNLSKMARTAYHINLTEQVGEKVWHRGTINGKTAWIESADVMESFEKATSRLGHLNGTSVKIYQDYAKQSSYQQAGAANTDEVFYIKKKASYNNGLYFLISRSPSATEDLVGWVKSTDMSSKVHATLNSIDKTFYLTGSGSSYDNAWGGKKNVIDQDLSTKQSQIIDINLTEKAGSDVWHRGVLNGRTVWVSDTNTVAELNTFTKYNLTFEEAVDRQMNGYPQTDKYRYSSAYIPKSAVQTSDAATISGSAVNLRTQPKFGGNVDSTVYQGTKVKIVKTVEGDSYEGSTDWYEIIYSGETLYVHSLLVNAESKAGTIISGTNVFESTSQSSHVFGTLKSGSTVNIVKVDGNWIQITFNVWRNAKRSDVEQFVNPDNNDPFQHLVLTSSAGVTAAELNKILTGKGILDGQGQAFIDASKQHSVNEVYLISHALLETGQGSSALATGVEVGENSSGTVVQVTSSNRSQLTDIKKVYNMFGIRAYDNCALKCGSEYAYTQGWTTPAKAITGGASFIGGDYIHNQYGQNTIYKMRWNHQVTYKQYATDVGWAAKQTTQIKNLYSSLYNPLMHFDFIDFK